MKTNSAVLEATCDFESVSPAFAELPYPPTKVCKKNKYYADLLSVDYCGMVSELSAITLYVDNEITLSGEHCKVAQTILSVAMAEMTHLQILGELIVLLGGELSYSANYNCDKVMWTPEYLDTKKDAREILLEAIHGEKAGIHQYQKHIKEIKDPYIKAVLARIIKDEEYHIFLFKTLLEEFPEEKTSEKDSSKEDSTREYRSRKYSSKKDSSSEYSSEKDSSTKYTGKKDSYEEEYSSSDRDSSEKESSSKEESSEEYSSEKKFSGRCTCQRSCSHRSYSKKGCFMEEEKKPVKEMKKEMKKSFCR
ncbi:MAG: hypothetical protein E7256_11090 [Lachnospiraceae bacterium]|nr:hypothetical protein [Lachnospiraceae bacterium]